MVVKAELEKLGFNPLQVKLGEVDLQESLASDDFFKIEKSLKPFGFELLKDKKKQVSEQIKVAIIQLIHDQNAPLKTNLSTYLSSLLHTDYNQLSNTFTEIEQQTIEQFFISQKIEKAKELLSYGELTLSQIANELHYSSVAHLSNQFKKITGITPSAYKQHPHNDRNTLDSLKV
ncbi:helix-turn-helix domain-containing protein [Pedobacter sp. MW01-1-1]|uniref:helix-turn-helix domain-containing protein n=1 Tax=Pedobacter sp. MW01-1-1 TaxID=3383027 RepID=UPI003FEFD494